MSNDSLFPSSVHMRSFCGERGGGSGMGKAKGRKTSYPRSCMKLQMGQATSLCFWKESGMTGCFV